MYITWMGNASVVLETENDRIVFDPFAQLIGGTNLITPDDFLEEENILITHGHFDHAGLVPTLLEEGDATVFCTKTPARTLESFGEFGDRIVQIGPGMEFAIGDFHIRTYQGRHIVFDSRLILETIRPLHFLRHIKNLPYILWASRTFKENGETLVYEIKSEGKRIVLMGSLNLDYSRFKELPKNPDLLIMPYQGSSDLPRAAKPVIGAIKPKKILLTHFDDAFPPITQDVDLRGLKRMMQTVYPEIPVIRPRVRKKMRFK